MYENEKKQFFFLLFRHNYDSEKKNCFGVVLRTNVICL